MDPIEGISGNRGATSASSLPSPAQAPPIDVRAHPARPEWQAAAAAPSRPAERPERASEGPVRSSPVGSGGRFEKFILAMQALRLDYGAASQQASTKEMRAAVQEIFSIDGLPQAFPPTPAREAAAADAARSVVGQEDEPTLDTEEGGVSQAGEARGPGEDPAAGPAEERRGAPVRAGVDEALAAVGDALAGGRVGVVSDAPAARGAPAAPAALATPAAAPPGPSGAPGTETD